jgi:DNA polymerase III delta prime subunit
MESMIGKPTLGWDAFKGYPDALKTAQRYVRAILENYERKPPAALLLHGPPGSGKTTLAKIIASQLTISPSHNITYFNVPKGTIAKAAQLGALFSIAAERAPSVILFDEVDGFMSKQHTALVPAINTHWVVVNPSGKQSTTPPYVLVIGTTNHPDRLDGAILSRFGHPQRSIELGPPDEATRKAILVDHLETVKHNLTEEDLATLVGRTAGSVGRDIAALVGEVASKVEDDFKQSGNPRNDDVISLADFPSQFKTGDDESTMVPESKGEFSNKLRKLFVEDENPSSGPDEMVISAKYMIEKLLSDEDLRLLGVKDTKKLRGNPNYLSANTKESAFLHNLLECLQMAFPSCRLVFNSDGKCKTFLALSDFKGLPKEGSSRLDRYQRHCQMVRAIGPSLPGKDRVKCWYFTRLRYNNDEYDSNREYPTVTAADTAAHLAGACTLEDTIILPF